MTKLVCLTRPIDPAVREALPDALKPMGGVIAPDIAYDRPEGRGLDRVKFFFGCEAEDLPNNEGWAEEMLNNMSTHCGTHVDAPYHSGNIVEGKTARRIHEVELNELFRPAIVLDLRPFANKEGAYTVEELQQAINAVRPIEPGDAVLLRTGSERFEPTQLVEWTTSYRGMSREGTLFLIESGAKILGTDSPGWDRPFGAMRKAFAETGDKSVLWDGHFAIQEKEAFIVQQLHNLTAIPPSGFHVGFFPMKLVGTSAAPARVVAFLD